MAAPKYFGKIWKIQIETILFDALDVEFTIKKSLRHEPNACELTVYGLSDATRKAIEALNIYDPKKTRGQKKSKGRAKKPKGRVPKTGKIRVAIWAGYKDTGLALMFLGDLRRGLSKPQRPEVSFEVKGEDGGTAALESRINESFPAGTTKLAVVEACADALGLGLGNLRTVEETLSAVYTHGTSLQGQAAQALKDVLRSERITYSIQNGTLQFVEAGQGLNTVAYDLKLESGLLDTPELDSGGGLIAYTVMIADLAPGGYVQLTSKDFKGVYYIKSMETKGDTSGNDWGHKLELFPG